MKEKKQTRPIADPIAAERQGAATGGLEEPDEISWAHQATVDQEIQHRLTFDGRHRGL